MRSLRAIGFLGALMMFSVSVSASYTLDEVLRAMEGKERDVKTMKFAFTQSVQFSGSTLAAKSSGQAILKRPDRMQVQQHLPVPQTIIVNGKKTWLYSPTNKQVFVGSGAKALFGNEFSKGFFPLSGTFSKLKNEFNFQLNSENPDSQGNLTLSGTPKSPDLGFSMELIVSENSWMPLETKITSESAVVTTKVKEIEINPNVADDLFKFKAPKGTEVLSF